MTESTKLLRLASSHFWRRAKVAPDLVVKAVLNELSTVTRKVADEADGVTPPSTSPAPAPAPTPAPTPSPLPPAAPAGRAIPSPRKPSAIPPYANSVGSPDVAHLQLILWEKDRNFLSSVGYMGIKEVEWAMDKDPSTPLMQKAYVYRANFTDSTPVDLLIDIDFTPEEAKAWADKLAQRFGVQPKIHRDNYFHLMFIKGGLGGATAESSGHFFAIFEERMLLRIGQNKGEETIHHEGTHAGIQQAGNGRGYNFLDSPEWKAAVAADGAFITQYAMTNAQEDFAESSLFAYAMIFHPERFPDADFAKVWNQIPNRIAFFRKIYAGS